VNTYPYDNCGTYYGLSFSKKEFKGMFFLKRNMGMCISCEDYFWKSQLSMLPSGSFLLNKRYCPQCYPKALEEYTRVYWGNA